MNHWQRVQELFAATAELEGAERARALRAGAGPDSSLIAEVEALLRADGIAAPQFAQTAAELLHEIADEPPAADLCGQQFGSYRIETHLASGGMGHVYLATRTTAGIERRVAIKVLRPGLGGAGLLARFQQERATLAALEHEHIVGFLDAAALPDGRPYLVMEYVDGVPLTDWIVRPELGLRRRLDLFLQILSAVQCAHRSLVVHRDLKPSNVLVNAQGRPKLLDFGIAAVLAPDHLLAPTSGGDAPLTPMYASPEQLRGASVTTASDVYSLGVLLRDVVGGGLPEAAIPSDLAAIARKATAPDPEQRYASADRFAEDIRRHLAGSPVSARPARWGYRAACFLRRNRWGVLAGLAIVAALGAGWVAADLSRRRAERESSIGWGAHAEARMVARIFEDLLATVAAERADLATLAVQRLERTLEAEVAGRPEGEALTRLALSRLYLLRGDFDPAMRHVDRALFLCETARGLGSGDLRRAREMRERILAARSAR